VCVGRVSADDTVRAARQQQREANTVREAIGGNGGNGRVCVGRVSADDTVRAARQQQREANTVREAIGNSSLSCRSCQCRQYSQGGHWQ
jgi:hypothetical protein